VTNLSTIQAFCWVVFLRVLAVFVLKEHQAEQKKISNVITRRNNHSRKQKRTSIDVDVICDDDMI
jgi:hypothetical protein